MKEWEGKEGGEKKGKATRRQGKAGGECMFWRR